MARRLCARGHSFWWRLSKGLSFVRVSDKCTVCGEIIRGGPRVRVDLSNNTPRAKDRDEERR